ncbi:MAG TPA: AAA family ATPase [Byssovorax sp.]
MTTRLTGLRIEQFRNAAPCDLEFSDGINVVLGPNGSGKTTLLDLISGILTSPIGEDYADAKLTADLTVTGDDFQMAIAPAAKMPGATADDGEILGKPMPPEVRLQRRGEPSATAVATSQIDVPRLWALLRARGVREPRGLMSHRFDEALGFFDVVLARSPRPPGPYYAAAKLAAGWFALPSCLDSRIRKLDVEEAPPTLEWRPLAVGAFTSLAGFSDAGLKAHLIRSAGGFAEYGDLTAVFRRGDDVAHDFSGLSYGQKRLFAFLIYSTLNPHIIVADELVNGLHHNWIQACLAVLVGKQAFLTSQNPLLIDYLEFDSVEQVKRTFILCDVDAQQRFVWRNMDDDEAASFFAAYKVGIQHVGEILRTKGFW